MTKATSSEVAVEESVARVGGDSGWDGRGLLEAGPLQLIHYRGNHVYGNGNVHMLVIGPDTDDDTSVLLDNENVVLPRLDPDEHRIGACGPAHAFVAIFAAPLLTSFPHWDAALASETGDATIMSPMCASRQ